MSSTDVKEIIYHCECRRFVSGTPSTACRCHECGREHAPADDCSQRIVKSERRTGNS